MYLYYSEDEILPSLRAANTPPVDLAAGGHLSGAQKAVHEGCGRYYLVGAEGRACSLSHVDTLAVRAPPRTFPKLADSSFVADCSRMALRSPSGEWSSLQRSG